MDTELFAAGWVSSGLALGVAWLAFLTRGKELTAKIGISPTAALYTLTALSLGWLFIGGIAQPERATVRPWSP
jgi:hypothetical protein